MRKLTLLPIILAVIFLSCNQANTHKPLAEEVNSQESFYESMELNRQWPGYRGYFASGYLDQTNLPDSFNVETSHNIKWDIQIPGLGLSCPVIWDKQVFITTAISESDSEGYRTGLMEI